MSLVNSAKKQSMLFMKVGDMKAWELYVAHALLMFLAGFVFAALKKLIPAVFGDGDVSKLASNAAQLTQAVAITGQYRDAPKELQIV